MRTISVLREFVTARTQTEQLSKLLNGLPVQLVELGLVVFIVYLFGLFYS